MMMADVVLDVDLLEKCDRKLRRREYFKHNKRLHRQQDREERESLLREVQELKQKIQRFSQRAVARESNEETTTMLSWRDMALALGDGFRTTAAQHEALKAQVAEYKVLRAMMQAWVATNAAVTTRLDGNVATWRDTTLMVHPASRQLGKEWIMKRMYHHTDEWFQFHGFPAIDANETVDRYLDFEFADGEYIGIYRDQVEIDSTLDDCVEYMHATMLTLRCYIPQYSPSIPMLLDQEAGNTRQYVLVTPSNEYVNVLTGEFRTKNRCVIVIRQIVDDEACVGGRHQRQRSRMQWLDIHEIPGSNGRRLKFRIATHMSQSFTPEDGVIPLEVDALDFGISLTTCPEYLQESRFKSTFQRNLSQSITDHAY
ncbi:Aste57867_8631 [Aphanomyces stellatus]|uniref:Aste57867_8631 protein n=1 Tax=Aphanomyces stellatus TaxID=120398 RepID=A0A485KKZ1_9STRA|nr:hypothetical protein As57867_008597 [Aphanomyces stellatus]VFT85517.1 Aste57867_8631 [Aphanomyces stellatus]